MTAKCNINSTEQITKWVLVQKMDSLRVDCLIPTERNELSFLEWSSRNCLSVNSPIEMFFHEAFYRNSLSSGVGSHPNCLESQGKSFPLCCHFKEAVHQMAAAKKVFSLFWCALTPRWQPRGRVSPPAVMLAAAMLGKLHSCTLPPILARTC